MSTTKSADTTTTSTRQAKDARRASSRMSVPWIDGTIDYGPAQVALEDLASWAFDLAAASVADWPQARRRVKNARRFVTALIRGKRVRTSRTTEEDVAFTASLLVRIFDHDLRLGLQDILTVLSEIGLPTVDVPNPAPRPVALRGLRLIPGSRPVAVRMPCAGCEHASRAFGVAA